MTELWEAVKAWPAIVQGAMGSALFALIVFLGQKVWAILSPRLDQLSTNRRRARVITQIARIRAIQAKDNHARGYFAALLWLRASRDVIKGIIWLALGLCFGSFAGVLATVGYAGSVFYMFSALDAVKAIKPTGNEESDLLNLLTELKKLDPQANV